MNKTLGFALFGAGGLYLAYRFGLLCNWGLGPDCSPPAAVPPPGASAPPAGGATPAPAPTTTPAAPAPGSTSFALVGPVAPDINNSLKGQVSIQGSTRTLNLTPDGQAWDTSGQNVTASLVALGVDPGAIYSAMQAAMQTQHAAVTTPVALAGMQAVLDNLKKALPFNPALQPQVDLLTQQIASAKAAAGLAGYRGIRGMGARRPLYPIRGVRPINYVRVPRRRFA